jgi:serine/threonine-protein kinase
MALTLDMRIGSVLAGYRIEALLGRGGMGVVYLAQDLSLERKVALKLLAPELSSDEAFRERFLRESRLAASIDHPNVIPIHEAGETDGTLYIVMRYVDGTDLRRLLAEEAPLEPERAIALLSQVAEALDVAHEHGLVHRDVKPANVLIVSRADSEHVYLADFGLSREVAAAGSLERSHFAGSADYVAPEQIGRRRLDGRADLYALACVLQECLAGEPPFRRESLITTLFAHVNDDPAPASHSNPNLPAAIDQVLLRALAKEPAERQTTCGELIEEARNALGIAAPRTGWRNLPRRTKLAAALVALAIAAAAAVPALLLTGADAQPAKKTLDTTPTLAITADSVQHIDPATNGLASTTRIGDGVNQLAVGEGAIWATRELWSADALVGAWLYRIAPSTGAITGQATPDGAASNVAAGLGAVWVVQNLWSNGAMSAFDPETLNSRDVPVSLISNVSRAAGPVTVGKFVWVVATERTRSSVPRPLPDTSSWRIGGLCELAIPCFTKVTFPPVHVTTAAAAANGVLWLAGYVDHPPPGAGRLMRIDEESHRYLGSTPLDFIPTGLAVADGALWVADPVGDRLVRMDAVTRQVIERIPVGRNPTAVATGFGSVWVTNYDDGTVSRIDPATNQVVATIEVGPHPDHIAGGEGGVWVAVHAL